MRRTIGFLLLAFGAQSAFGQAAVKCRFVTSLDTPITAPGTYCFSKSLVGKGLVIDSGNVTVDLRGFSIINSQVPTGDTGVYTAQAGVRFHHINQPYLDGNITVRNGNIVGFDYGVMLGFPTGVRNGTLTVENLFVRGSVVHGISVLGFNDMFIRNNHVTDTVGANVWGIYARGRGGPYAGDVNVSNLVIEGNRVDNTRAQGQDDGNSHGATGILADGAANVVINDNVVTNLSTTVTRYNTTGIRVQQQHPNVALLQRNIVLNPAIVPNSYGISGGHTNQPSYTGAPGVGTTALSKVYGFAVGISNPSVVYIDGVARGASTFTYASNLVAACTRDYVGGTMGKGNRTE